MQLLLRLSSNLFRMAMPARSSTSSVTHSRMDHRLSIDLAVRPASIVLQQADGKGHVYMLDNMQRLASVLLQQGSSCQAHERCQCAQINAASQACVVDLHPALQPHHALQQRNLGLIQLHLTGPLPQPERPLL